MQACPFACKRKRDGGIMWWGRGGEFVACPGIVAQACPLSLSLTLCLHYPLTAALVIAGEIEKNNLHLFLLFI